MKMLKCADPVLSSVFNQSVKQLAIINGVIHRIFKNGY